MVPEFDTAAWSLKLNEISQPVKTQYGYHLIQVTEITPAKQQTFAEVKETIRTDLLNTEKRTVWDAWLAKTEKELGVTYKTGMAPTTTTTGSGRRVGQHHGGASQRGDDDHCVVRPPVVTTDAGYRRRGRVTAPAALSGACRRVSLDRRRHSRPDEAARRERVLAELAALYDLTDHAAARVPLGPQADPGGHRGLHPRGDVRARRRGAGGGAPSSSRRGVRPWRAGGRTVRRRRSRVTAPSRASWATCCSRCTSWPRWRRRRAGTIWARWRRASTRKLVRRHPHIFGDASAETPDDVRRTWDEIKRTTEGREGIFHEVPLSFPATLYAQKVQQRAATVGFDWREPAEVLAKIEEEAEELRVEMARPRAPPRRDSGPRAGRPRKWAICCSRWSTWRASSRSTRS